MEEYLHGYTKQEYDRLVHQAEFLEDKVYNDIQFPKQGLLLELGCGVGAQTKILLRRNPDLRIIAVDRSQEAIDTAKVFNKSDRVEFICADLNDFVSPEPADAAFFCWMLEHADKPEDLLVRAKKNLKEGAPIHLVEVQNNSLYAYPCLELFYNYWDAYNSLQMSMQGDPFIGVKLPYYLENAGFNQIEIRPQMFIYNKNNLEGLKGICNYWWRLMDSASSELAKRKMVNLNEIQATRDHLLNLHQNEEAHFSFTFIHAKALA